MAQLPFADRTSAGAALAEELAARHYQDPVVFALPRGGVPVAAPIARALKAPLDILLVRKIGVPWQPEFAAGSIIDGEHPDIIMNEQVVRTAGVKQSDIDAIAKRELLEIERRRTLYAPGRKPLSAKGKTAILVDDGIATGASIRAAIAGVRRRQPLRIVVAVSVAPPDTVADLRRQADEVVCLAEPEPFGAVGYFYRDFHQLEDSEVIPILAEAYTQPAADRS